MEEDGSWGPVVYQGFESTGLFTFSASCVDPMDTDYVIYDYGQVQFALTSIVTDEEMHPVGENAPIGGVGFDPGEPVTITLTGPDGDIQIGVGTIEADANGSFGVGLASQTLNSTAFYQVPAGLPTGSYPVRVLGTSSGRYYDAELSIVGELATATPTISGQPALGQTLTANPGSWSPEGVAFEYQWYADGVAITDAVAQTYVVTEADLGKTITVEVTGVLDGYESASVVSAGVGPVTEKVVDQKLDPIAPLGGVFVPQAAGSVGFAALLLFVGVSILGVRLRRVS